MYEDKLKDNDVSRKLSMSVSKYCGSPTFYRKSLMNENSSIEKAGREQCSSPKKSLPRQESLVVSPLKFAVISAPEEDKLSPRKMTTLKGSDSNVCYLNDYPKIAKPVNPNPNIIIGAALHDLLVLLRLHKNKGPLMFQAAKSNQTFLYIEKQAAVLRVYLYKIFIA